MARVLTDRSETGSHPVPLATESLTAHRVVEDSSQELAAVREFDLAKVRSGSCVTSIAGPNGAA
jgi:hypothetical protein